MRVKKIVSLIWMGLLCSIVYSESKILWDFGVVIKSSEDNNKLINNFIQNPTTLNKDKVKKNAIISDPFIPPILSSVKLKKIPHINQFNNGLTPLDKNIFQISNEAKRFYLKKNYKRVIEFINYIDLNDLSWQMRHDLECLLIHALYNTGDYRKAQDRILSLIEHNETGELYFLLATISESLGQTSVAKKYYLKVINQYPKSDYIASANIKIRILDQH